MNTGYSILRPPLHKKFWLPNRKQLLKLKYGDNVKLIFQVDEETPERMWVLITAQQSDEEWTGIIDNDAIGSKTAAVLPAGKEITFHPLDIIQIPTPTHRLKRLYGKIMGRTTEQHIVNMRAESKHQD